MNTKVEESVEVKLCAYQYTGSEENDSEYKTWRWNSDFLVER